MALRYCWLVLIGKKRYPIKSHHMQCLVTFVDKGCVLEGHKDVHEAVRDELYREDQERLSKRKRKGGLVDGTGVPYPPININVLLSQSTAHGIDVSTSIAAVDLTLSPLKIPGSTDRAVEEYTEWSAVRAHRTYPAIFDN